MSVSCLYCGSVVGLEKFSEAIVCRTCRREEREAWDAYLVHLIAARPASSHRELFYLACELTDMRRKLFGRTPETPETPKETP